MQATRRVEFSSEGFDAMATATIELITELAPR